VACAVCHVGDEFFARPLRPAQQAVNDADEQADNIDILPFGKATDVVCVADVSPVEDDVNGAGVILHIEPVAHVLPLAVDGKGFALQDVADAERYQLLRELTGTVVVGTVGHQRRHAVSVVVRPHKVVGGGLGGAVGAVGIVVRCFPEEFTAVGGGTLRLVEFQRSVNLICGDVVETFT